MPTLVQHTIGTSSRDYSTVQLWLDAAPDLVAGDKIWEGLAYNDTIFAGAWDATAINTDATRYVHLTCAAGQSFYDNANVRTNNLYWTETQGVAAARTANYSAAFNANNMRVSRWQLQQGGSQGCVVGPYLKDLIVDTSGNSGVSGSPGAVRYNVLVIQRTTTGDGFVCQTNYGGTVTHVGCTAIVPSNVTNTSGTGFTATGGSGNIMQSCGSFGFNTCVSAGGWDTTASKNNATNKASGLPGSSNQHNVTYTSVTPFVQASQGGGNLDFRSIAATALAANGFLDATNAALDISGYTRANPPTIGHWELTAAGGAASVPYQPWYALAPTLAQ